MAAKRKPPAGRRKPLELKMAPFIEATGAYPLSSFSSITGMHEAALKAARREGLVVRKAGNRSFVLGRDFFSFLDQQSREKA